MKFIRDNLTILSIVLIMLGYCNLQIYYTYFHIKLIDYLSPTELLLSFLPFVNETLPVLSILLPLVALVVFDILRLRSPESVEWQKLKDSLDHSLWTSLKRLFSKNSYSGRWYIIALNIVVNLIDSVMKSAMNLALMWGIFYTLYLVKTKNNDIYKTFGFYAFVWGIGIFWYWTTLESFIAKRLHPLGKSLLAKFSLPLLPLFIAFSIYALWQHKRAIQLIHGIEEEKVRFDYKGKHIQSGVDTLFLGRTQSYLFLRQPSTSKAMIFPASDVENLEFMEIDTVSH
jgi:hypothetical protein